MVESFKVIVDFIWWIFQRKQWLLLSLKEKMILEKRKKLNILFLILIICFLNYNINTLSTRYLVLRD